MAIGLTGFGFGSEGNSGFLSRTQGFMQGATQAYGSQRPIQQEEEKTAGGALMSGVSGAATGASIGSLFSPAGTAIGAVVGGVAGLAAYYM